jgi:hypothetical protein
MSETFDGGAVVWQHKHAPDGHRFEVVGSEESPSGEHIVTCKILGDGPDAGNLVEIRASALAIAED